MLFPYTTLFRSRRGAPVRERRRSWGHLDARVGNRRARLRRRESHRIETRPTRRRIDGAGGMAGAHTERTVSGTDRKSTRLNSSHVAISYAVFCLKKKKKARTHKRTKH